MSYIKKTLADGEAVQGQFALHWTRYAAPVFLLMVAIAMNFDGWMIEIIILLTLISAYMFFQLFGIEQGVTTRRIYYKSGVFSRHTKELLLNAVETVELRQTLSDRLMGTGSVVATGKGGAAIEFLHIENPLWVKQMIESAASPQAAG